MTNPKAVIGTLDLKLKPNSETKSEVLTLVNINKSIWAKKFERLCDQENLSVLRMKRK
jgi:hypothetical protein